MKLETLGHACTLLTDDDGQPFLLTDPWLVGSTYWRSWWLQNYPTQEKIAALSAVKFAYITHEHPDHFHPPSLRKLGKKPLFLSPDLPENRMLIYLQEHEFTAESLTSLQWRELSPSVRILSISLWNDDSVLLVDTPEALVFKLNDSKPSMRHLRHLRRFADDFLPEGKTRVVLNSYSPASIVNSFMRNAQRINMKNKIDYVRHINRICDVLAATYFMPFASQAVFLRSDSKWANDFKVSFEDLRDGWATQTTLLHPYTTLDLGSGDETYVRPEDYNEDWRSQLDKVTAQEHRDDVLEITDADIERLEKKMRVIRWMAAILFPRGVGFRIRELELHFSPWTGRVTRGGGAGSFTLNVPAQALKDVLQYGYFGDLGTTMFTIVNLNSRTRPVFVYLFIMVLTLHDRNHIAGVNKFARWAMSVFHNRSWNIPSHSG